MKISDLLRNLADTLDSTGAAMSQEEQPADSGDSGEVGVFVSPLQQELELKKKEQGVENIFDEPEHSAETGDADELTIIKRNAGIQ